MIRNPYAVKCNCCDQQTASVTGTCPDCRLLVETEYRRGQLTNEDRLAAKAVFERRSDLIDVFSRVHLLIEEV